MRKVYLLMLLFTASFLLLSPVIEANVFSDTSTRDQLRLRGYWPSIPIRSASDPVMAFQSKQTLEIYFLSNVGNVVVSIERNEETLYQQNVGTATERQVFIDLSTFESGEYTLKIVNDNGDCLIGEFLL